MLEDFGGELEFPVAGAFEALEGILGLFLPSVEVADEVNGGGVGSPFADDPLAGRAVQAIIEGAVGEVSELVLAAGEFGYLSHGVVVATLDSGFVGFEPRVVLDEVDVFHSGSLGCLGTLGRFLGRCLFLGLLFCFHGVRYNE